MSFFLRSAFLGLSMMIYQLAMAQNQTMDSLSYSFGLLIGKNMKSQGVEEIDAASLVEAITDVFEENEFAIQPEEANTRVQNYFKEAQARKAEEAQRKEREFLAANQEKEGVKTTASGLQYEVLTEGSGGEKPTPSSRVTVHYEGRLLDGTIFDSSYKRGEPATFGLNQVIKGWTEALQLMDVGTKMRLFIPYELAYGPQGSPPRIPPYSTLVFEVELLGIE